MGGACPSWESRGYVLQLLKLFQRHRRDGDKPLLDLVTPELENSASPRAPGLENSGPVTRPLGLQQNKMQGYLPIEKGGGFAA